MHFLEQMSIKFLAQAVQNLGLALNETLCVEPDPNLVRSLLLSVRHALDEFEEIYFTTTNTHNPPTQNHPPTS